MNRIDYELGLAKEQYGEDFDSADGKGLFLTCNAGCLPRHPFNKSRRESCKATCAAKFQVRQETGKIFGANNAIAANATAAAAAVAAAAEAEAEAEAAGTKAAGTEAGGEDPNKAGLSKGAMIGIGVGVLALVVGAFVIIKRK